MLKLLLGLAVATTPLTAAAQQRVAALGGAVTEIVAALGEEGRLVGRDTTSTEPASVRALPDLGYVRALSPEGVLSVNPDLILAEEGAGPPATLDLLRAGGVPYVTVADGFDGPGIAAKITTVADALGVADKGRALAAKVEAEMTTAVDATEGKPRRRVLFVLSAQGGRIMASGQGTGADHMISLAGGQNALEGFQGYKPVTDEALAAAAPDVILVMDRGAAATPKPEVAAAPTRGPAPGGGHATDDLLSQPAIAATPAGRAGRIIRMDGLYLLGFGPRTPAAVGELARHLAAVE